jgi:hypothetical protein
MSRGDSAWTQHGMEFTGMPVHDRRRSDLGWPGTGDFRLAVSPNLNLPVGRSGLRLSLGNRDLPDWHWPGPAGGS